MFAIAVLFLFSGVALAEVNPSDTVISDTYGVFKFTATSVDYTNSVATVTHQSCANNGSMCDSPLVLTGYVVTVKLSATTCTVKKGDNAAAACNNGSYFFTNLETDIDADAKGLEAGCDTAFTAGYGP